MLMNFEREFLDVVRRLPRQWVPIPIGSANPDDAPDHLLTDIRVKFTQGRDESFCLTYSLASVLWYVGWNRAAKAVAKIARVVQGQSSKQQLRSVFELLTLKAPQFALPVIYNRHTKNGKCRLLDVDRVIRDGAARPLIFIPLGRDGSVAHGTCIIDDLLFDSTQKFALKLSYETLHWVCGQGGYSGVWQAYELHAKGCPEQKRKPRLTQQG